jgi:hypothetical protein
VGDDPASRPVASLDDAELAAFVDLALDFGILLDVKG